MPLLHHNEELLTEIEFLLHFPVSKCTETVPLRKNEHIHEWTLNDESASSYHERLSLLQNEIAGKWGM